jgi:enoyl-CoA hydratase
MTGLLSIEAHGDVALVILRRPEKRNALSIDLRRELADAFRRLSDDDGVGAIVLTGAGSAFCSGMDISQFGGDRAHKEELVESSLGLFDALGGCRRPIVAAINGPALAGGFALALVCDLRIAGEGATMGFPETKAGIPPAYAPARAALTAAVARDLCFTGRIVDAVEALALGVVSEICPDEEIVAHALARAGGIAALPRAAMLATKERIRVERDQVWGPLFAQEERDLRAALLGEEPEDAA